MLHRIGEKAKARNILRLAFAAYAVQDAAGSSNN